MQKLSLSDVVDDSTLGKTKVDAVSMVNPSTDRPHSQRYSEILEKRRSLPVWQQKQEFLDIFAKNQIMILVGETGSGKTTQVPQFIVEAGYTSNRMQIACTQPHQVAAMSASRRVAEEMDVLIGEEVGYSIPFDDRSGAKTVLKYMTDGMLQREVMTDPLFERYKVIILDEAHERTLATDVLFGLLKEALQHRPDLKVIVMSATLEAERFQKYFNGAPLMKVPGRGHPVDTGELFLFTPMVSKKCTYKSPPEDPGPDYVEAAIRTVVQIHIREAAGDILVFLTGEDDIEDACLKITWELQSLCDHEVGPVTVVPIYSTLPQALQQKIFEAGPAPLRKGGPPGRKIVVSTNIAETSLTIDGIVYVIDAGFIKQKIYNHLTGAESVFASLISKASADQRAGRAGRAQPGKCFRLYTEKSFQNDFHLQTNPEILRSNLSNVVLTLKKLGLKLLNRFNFINPPEPGRTWRAVELLQSLGALDYSGWYTRQFMGDFTSLGELFSEFPLEPQMSKMLIASPGFNCSNEILTISAMLSVPNCFLRPANAQQAADEAKARFGHTDGDHLTLLNVYHAYKQNGEDATWCSYNFVNVQALKSADNMRGQLLCIMRKLNLGVCSTAFTSPNYSTNIRKAILAGYFTQVAYLESGGHYLTLKDTQMAHLDHSTSLDLKPRWVIYNEVVQTSSNRNFIRTVTDVREEWLFDIALPYFRRMSVKSGEAGPELKSLYMKWVHENCEIKEEHGS